MSRSLPWALALCAVALGLALAASAQPRATRARQAARPTVEHSVSTRLRHDGKPYQLHRFRVPLARVRIDVVDAGMGTDLARYVRRGAALAINGGFYGTDHRPEGLVIARSRILSAYLPRIGGGIVALARARAVQLDAELPFTLPEGTEFAIQCRPRLVVGGRVNIRRPSPQTAARTALCLRDGGASLDVYVARADPSRGRSGPTLWTLAHHLLEEGCEDALNLDGGPSTGTAWRDARGVHHLPPRRGIRHAILFHLAP
ncbi:MAG TPA: phosphodiester glycosidase family protein [Sandaracinaceae bacterium]